MEYIFTIIKNNNKTADAQNKFRQKETDRLDELFDRRFRVEQFRQDVVSLSSSSSSKETRKIPRKYNLIYLQSSAVVAIRSSFV